MGRLGGRLEGLQPTRAPLWKMNRSWERARLLTGAHRKVWGSCPPSSAVYYAVYTSADVLWKKRAFVKLSCGFDSRHRLHSLSEIARIISEEGSSYMDMGFLFSPQVNWVQWLL